LAIGLRQDPLQGELTTFPRPSLGGEMEGQEERGKGEEKGKKGMEREERKE